jgi:hypothetical protein
MGVMTLQLLGSDNVRGFPPSLKAWEAAGEPIEHSGFFYFLEPKTKKTQVLWPKSFLYFISMCHNNTRKNYQRSEVIRSDRDYNLHRRHHDDPCNHHHHHDFREAWLYSL